MQYLFSAIVAFALLFYAFKDISWADIGTKFQNAQYSWIVVAIICFIISNLARAYRWLLLLQPLGYKPSLWHGFLAVKVGYFINLVFPRAGEVSRSAFIQKMAGVSATTAFGTIVLERLIDIVILLTIMLIALLGEYARLKSLLLDGLIQKLQQLNPMNMLIVGLVLFALLGLVYYFFSRYKKQLYAQTWVAKLIALLAKVAEGVLSIRKVNNKTAFVFHTLLIWLMYFCMSYSLFFCFPNTSQLGLWVGYIILVVGAIGMAAPVQGGIGTYHLLVSATFILFGLNPTEAMAMAVFMHTAQTLATMLTGGTALAISMFITKNRNTNPNPTTA